MAHRCSHSSLRTGRHLGPLIQAVALAALLWLSACSSGPAPASPTPATSAASTSSPTGQTAVEADCGTEVPASVAVADITVTSTNQVTLSGAALGSGKRGVVMLHQTNDGVCGWLPYAAHLAQQGFHVLLFDRRCEGRSSCADGENAFHHAADVSAAVADLRGRGADQVAVVGASLGGAIALGACTVVDVDSCVALSPALFDIKLGAGLTPNKAITRLDVPTLVAAAPDDGSSAIDDVTAFVRRAPKDVITFVELPTGAGHGWDTVNNPSDPTQRSTFSTTLIAFLTQHLS